MATRPRDIVNQAILLMGGNEPLVTGELPGFDSSKAGLAAATLYAATVATVARQSGWDFGRSAVILTKSGNLPPNPWSFEYNYPAGVQVWQLLPSGPIDKNDPRPVNWTVGNAITGGGGQQAAQSKVIWTNLDAAMAYFNGNPNENTWDPLFREAVVRLLASGMAMALSGKPDTARELIESGSAMAQLGQSRSD